MDFKKERVNCHNRFPEIVWFKAEEKFKEQLDKTTQARAFIPASLSHGKDQVYQTCIGHLIDGLEFFPYRPDFMFDHCFKAIDVGASPMFRSKGLLGVAQGLGGKLLVESNNEWEAIILLLGENIPLTTCRFIVKRICEAHFLINDKNSKSFVKRASACFGTQTYNEFISKFALDENGAATGKISSERINKGASFLKLYLAGKKGTNQKINTTYGSLDLTNNNNLPSAKKRIELILSLLLFTMRNERSHGTVLSPFRTSKSTLERYQSYYFAMLCSYIFCLGVFKLRGFGSLTGESIRACCEENLKLQNIFFS